MADTKKVFLFACIFAASALVQGRAGVTSENVNEGEALMKLLGSYDLNDSEKTLLHGLLMDAQLGKLSSSEEMSKVDKSVLTANADERNLPMSYTSILRPLSFLSSLLYRPKCYFDVVTNTSATVLTSGRYFIGGTTLRNWFDASQLCASKHMRLASIEGPAENNIIVAEINRRINAGSLTSTDVFYIGASNNADTTKYQWSGTGVQVGSSQSPLTNWHSSQPPTDINKYCVVYKVVNSELKWTTQACSVQSYFICEWEQPCKFSL